MPTSPDNYRENPEKTSLKLVVYANSTMGIIRRRKASNPESSSKRALENLPQAGLLSLNEAALFPKLRGPIRSCTLWGIRTPKFPGLSRSRLPFRQQGIIKRWSIRIWTWTSWVKVRHATITQWIILVGIAGLELIPIVIRRIVPQCSIQLNLPMSSSRLYYSMGVFGTRTLFSSFTARHFAR